jgi:hypothetical protein
LEEVQWNQAKDLWITPNLTEEDPFVVVELPSFDMVSVRILKGKEWAYFTAFMDSYLGENAWIAVFEKNGEVIPWLGSVINPKKDQLVVVRMLKEEECSWDHAQSTYLDATKYRYPSWECLLYETAWKRKVGRLPPLLPEIDRVEEAVPLEENLPKESPQSRNPSERETSPGETPLAHLGELEDSDFGNFIISQPFQGLIHEPRLKGRTRRRILFRISIADACRSGMGGKLDPLQLLQIGGQMPLSAENAGLLKVDSFRKRKEELWQNLNPEKFKERRAALQAEIDFECDMPESWQVDEELWEDPDIRSERITLGEYWEDRFYEDRKERKLAVMWLMLRSKGGWNPRLWRNLWEKLIDDEEFGQDFKARHEKNCRKGHP